METVHYTRRREEIRTYFDRTAVEAWKRFATEAPLSRIRESVRRGRAMMRATMLGMLPDDLSGWRVLDAGCGAGALAVALARRGADVVAIDLAPQIVRFAAETAPAELGPGRIEFLSGDMLSPDLGRFDAVVAMDSLIHYAAPQAVEAIAALARRTERAVIFTFAPRTPLLAVMHAAGRLFPRGDRAPAIEPVAEAALRAGLAASCGAAWHVAGTRRVAHGFYTSQAMEVRRT